MTRVLHIARREWLEQRRQPVMLAVIGALYSFVAVIVLTALLLLELVASDPSQVQGIGALLGMDDGLRALELMAGTVVTGFNFLTFTQFLGIGAVLAGHTVLHDRQCGTLTFLLLSPVRRAELIAGKVLGAIGPAWLLYLLINGPAALVAAQMSVTAPHAAWLPSSPAWWVAFLLGGPLLALCVGTLCTILSALSRDVRTAQQGVWFLVFFATFGAGFLLTQALPAGVGTQLLVAAFGAGTTAVAIAVGASVITRDLGR